MHHLTLLRNAIGLFGLLLLALTGLAQQTTTLVPTGSVWKYLDNGSNQGTTWIQPDFDDSTWPSGPAQLGYGDGDEATLVSYGINPGAKFPTTYFRHAFVVEDAASVLNIRLRAVRDDGIAVYLNGQEIARDNLVAGAAYNTFAFTFVAGEDESRFFEYGLHPGVLLVEGTNVLAVEIHQSDGESSDISFDLELLGFRDSTTAGTVIDFDDVTAPCSFAETVGLTAEYEGLGVAFQGPGGADGGAILNACGNFNVTGYSGDNFLAFNVGGSPGQSPETVFFAMPVSRVSFRAGSSSGGEVSMTAYDASNTAMGPVTLSLSSELALLEIDGVDIVRVVIESTSSVWVLDDFAFSTGPVLVNGSFETGDFTGWVISDLASPYSPLLVRPSGQNPVGLFETLATDGMFVATHGFDGGGPGVIRIAQDVAIPANRTLLTFDYRAQWSISGALDRRFYVTVEPAGGGAVLYTTNILTAPANSSIDSGPLSGEVELAAFAGSTVRISFDASVPENFTGPGFFQLDNIDLEAGEPPPVDEPPVITTQPLSQTVYVGQTVVLSVGVTGTPPFTYMWEFNGQILDGETGSTLTLSNISMEDGGTYRVLVSNAFGSALSEKTTLTVEEVPPRPAYLRSQINSPWGTTVNEELLNQVFGAGNWDDLRFETANPSQVFAPTRSFVFMDGSDSGANAMEAFLTSNRTLMEGWVSDGGILFLNSAPNVGDGMNFGFGVTLDYSESTGTAVAHDSNHPILLGPATPVGTQWSGSSFAHAVVVGVDLSPILVSSASGSIVLGEMPYGTGHVFFGGMTTPNFHSPQPQANNLRANIFSHAVTLYNPSTNAPPEFFRQPENVSTLEGRTVTLSGQVTGTRPLSYQWFHDGSPVPGATAATLVLPNAVASQSGGYELVVTNLFGAATSRVAQVLVRMPLGVAGFYYDTQFNTPIDLTESLLIAGFTPVAIPDITEAVLDDFDLILITQDGNGATPEVRTRVVDLEDWVQAGGRLIVHDPIWINPEAPRTNPLLIGAPATEVVGLESGDANFLIPGGAPLINGPYGMLGNLDLDSTVGNLTHGGYALLANVPRNLTAMMSQGANSTRLVGFAYGHNQGAVFFSTLSLDYLLSGNEPAMTQKARDIYLPNVVAYIFGRTSQGAPVIGVQPQSQTVFDGNTARLTVTVSGALPLSFQWYRDGMEIPGATQSTLVLENVSTNDSGSFHVVVSNAQGSVTSAQAALNVISLGKTFQILSLTTLNSQVTEHNNLTGDDRGPLAVGSVNLLYSGDGGMAAFSLDNISQASRVSDPNDVIISDLNSERIYVLGNGNVPAQPFGNNPVATTLLGLNEATGAINPAIRIDLSMPIPLRGGGNQSGLFAGFDRILVHNGARVYHISLPSGAVIDLGPMIEPPHAFSESWAYWGVAEYFGGSLYMVYVRDPQNIVRTRVPDGLTTTLATFNNLSDMAAFSVSIRRDRWYFHHEGSSQFGGISETVGHATALFDADLPDTPPRILTQPLSQAVAPGSDTLLKVLAVGTKPLSYQWYRDEEPVPGATGAELPLHDITPAMTGTYVVTVSNALGATNSLPAVISIDPAGPLVFTGFDHTFTKPNGADWTQAQNQDRITDGVWITRQNNQGLFNIVLEDFFEERFVSPQDTEWAFGSALDWATLNFQPWVTWHNRNPIGAVNRPAVLHLISENIYLDIMMTQWNSGGQGGFAYQRALIELPNAEPFIRQQPQSVTVGPNSDVAFSVKVIGQTPFTYQWSFDGQPINGATGDTLVLDNVSFPEQGAYTVEISNNLGSVTSAPAILTVSANGPRIFTGYDFTFSKANGADWNLPQNQDRITDLVWITRQNNQGLYNIRTETFFDRSISPANTEWAYGSALDWASLNFEPWAGWHNNSPPSSVNRNAVLHLISEDIYLDIRVTQWSSGGQGGFAYQRAVVLRPEPVFAGLNRLQQGFEDRNFSPLAFSVVDDNTPGQDLVFTAVSDNPELVADEGIVITRVAGSQTNFTVVVTPQPNAEGQGSYTIFATDLDGNVGGGVMSFRLNGINDPPVFVPGTNVVVLNNAGPVTLPGWAEELSPGPASESAQTLTITIGNNANSLFSQQPGLAADGTLSFTPNPGAAGEATVTVALRDSGDTVFGGRNTNSPVSFSISVLSPNGPPSVAASTFDALEDVVFNGELTGSDPDDDPLTFRLAAAPSLGVAMVQDSGQFSYAPPAHYSGMVQFVVVAHDGTVDSAPATITINVAAVNDAPSFQPGPALTILEDAGAQSWTGWATGMSAGPDDESGQTLHFDVDVDDPSLILEGPLLTPDGTLSLVPAPDVSGTVTLTVRLVDSGGTDLGGMDTSPPQMVQLIILPVNDAPAFVAGAELSVLEDAGVVSFPAWATGIGPGPEQEQAQALSFDIEVGNPALIQEGPLLTPDGDLTFAPAADAFGTVEFTVTLRDNGGTDNGGIDHSAPQTVTVTIRPVNDAPGFTPGADVVVSEDAGPQSVPGWAAAMSPGPDNEASQQLQFAVVNDHPELFAAAPALSPSGTLSFTPAADAHGVATLTVRLMDDGGTDEGGSDQSAPYSVQLTIEPVNDPPTAQALAFSVEEDGEVLITLLGADVDGDALSYEILSGPDHGTWTPNGGYEWTYRPNADYNGTDRLTYRALDAELASEPAEVVIRVGAVNDPPVPVIEVGPLADLIPGSDARLILSPDNLQALVRLDASQTTDPEGDALSYSWYEAGDLLPFATGEVAEVSLGVGYHEVILVVDDGTDTASAMIDFEIISGGQGVELLIMQVDDSTLPLQRKRALIATLKAAAASFDRGSFGSGHNQLHAFQNKVLAQVAKDDPALAASLIATAQYLIDTLVGPAP